MLKQRKIKSIQVYSNSTPERVYAGENALDLLLNDYPGWDKSIEYLITTLQLRGFNILINYEEQ